MSVNGRVAPVSVGEPAPDFTIEAAHDRGTVSLADYRDRSPVLLALFRGLYWHFCRLHVVQLGLLAQKLDPMGVRTLGIVATDPERARLYFRFRRPRMPVGADPELITHRAYGLPNMAVPPGMWDAVERAAVRELALADSPPGGAYQQLARFDAYEVTAADTAEFERHQAQLTGQFLIDREGIVRWVNVECARDGLDGVDRLPPFEEVLAAARAL